MLEINPGLIVWTIITFLLLMFVLKIFAWKPLLTALHNREENIRNSIKYAEQVKQEAERLLEENRRQLAHVEDEAQRILNESRMLGEKLKNEMIDKTSQQARKMIEQARLEIERDKEAALLHLRSEIARLAIQAAEKIIDETLDEEKHRKIVDTYLQSLHAN